MGDVCVFMCVSVYVGMCVCVCRRDRWVGV